MEWHTTLVSRHVMSYSTNPDLGTSRILLDLVDLATVEGQSRSVGDLPREKSQLLETSEGVEEVLASLFLNTTGMERLQGELNSALSYGMSRQNSDVGAKIMW